MNLVRICIICIIVGGLATSTLLGCATHPSFPQSSITGRIVEVRIGESLNPQDVSAKQGDEVRWVNAGNDAVDISFFEMRAGLVSCQKGFVSTGWGYLFPGVSSEPEFLIVATIHGNQYASLCFADRGTYPYTMKKEAGAAGKEAGGKGTVTID
jgi:plastocyanin